LWVRIAFSKAKEKKKNVNYTMLPFKVLADRAIFLTETTQVPSATCSRHTIIDGSSNMIHQGRMCHPHVGKG